MEGGRRTRLSHAVVERGRSRGITWAAWLLAGLHSAIRREGEREMEKWGIERKRERERGEEAFRPSLQDGERQPVSRRQRTRRLGRGRGGWGDRPR